MRKQRQRLQQVTYGSSAGRQVYTLHRVEKRGVSHTDAATVRRLQPGDAIQQSGLARAGRAKQDRDACADGNIDVESESAFIMTETLLRRDLQLAGHFQPHRFHAARPRSPYKAASSTKHSTSSNSAVWFAAV